MLRSSESVLLLDYRRRPTAFACHHAAKVLGVSLKIDIKMTSFSQIMVLVEAPVIYTPCTLSLL